MSIKDQIEFFDEVYGALPKPKRGAVNTFAAVAVYLQIRNESPIMIVRYADGCNVVQGCYHDWIENKDGSWEAIRDCTCPEGTPCYHDWIEHEDGSWEAIRDCTCPDGTPCCCV